MNSIETKNVFHWNSKCIQFKLKIKLKVSALLNDILTYLLTYLLASLWFTDLPTHRLIFTFTNLFICTLIAITIDICTCIFTYITVGTNMIAITNTNIANATTAMTIVMISVGYLKIKIGINAFMVRKKFINWIIPFYKAFWINPFEKIKWGFVIAIKRSHIAKTYESQLTAPKLSPDVHSAHSAIGDMSVSVIGDMRVSLIGILKCVMSKLPMRFSDCEISYIYIYIYIYIY